MKVCNQCRQAYNDIRQTADCPHPCRTCSQPWSPRDVQGFSPDPYVHAVRHLDAAEDLLHDEDGNINQNADADLIQAEVMLGMGWALLAIAKVLSVR